MNIHCILTVGSDRLAQGVQMIESLSNQKVQLHLLWRGFNGISPILSFTPTTQMHVDKASLSTSRNLLLENLFAFHNIEPDDVICFADDDGLWPPDLSKTIIEVFDSELDWALGRFGPRFDKLDLGRFPGIDIELTSSRQVLSKAASINLYIRAGVVREIGGFDERLGVGTGLPIGEDVEYAIRVYRLLKRGWYVHRLCQIHPYKESSQARTHQLNLILLLVLQFRYGGVLVPLLRKTIRLLTEDSREFFNLKRYLRQARRICEHKDHKSSY